MTRLVSEVTRLLIRLMRLLIRQLVIKVAQLFIKVTWLKFMDSTGIAPLGKLNLIKLDVNNYILENWCAIKKKMIFLC